MARPPPRTKPLPRPKPLPNPQLRLFFPVGCGFCAGLVAVTGSVGCGVGAGCAGAELPWVGALGGCLTSAATGGVSVGGAAGAGEAGLSPGGLGRGVAFCGSGCG